MFPKKKLFSGRLKTKYAVSGCAGKSRLSLGYGFFTRIVDEQIFLLKILLESAEYREIVLHQPNFPLDEKKLTVAHDQRLRIGYFINDGFMKPVPG